MIKDIKTKGLEYFYHDGELYAVILRDDYPGQSVSFVTPDTFSQQLGFLPHKKGGVIPPHRHKMNRREILYTQETLLIKKGRVKVDFYDKDKVYVFSEEVRAGDVILLCGSGGHGFNILEDTVMIEVKQGPYNGMEDKERFEGIK